MSYSQVIYLLAVPLALLSLIEMQMLGLHATL